MGRLGTGHPCRPGRHCAAAPRPLRLHLRAPRRQQGPRCAASQRRLHLRHDRDRLGSSSTTGCPLAGVEIAFRPPHRATSAPDVGGEGEILVRGAHALPLLPRRRGRTGDRTERRVRLVRHRGRRPLRSRRTAGRLRPDRRRHHDRGGEGLARSRRAGPHRTSRRRRGGGVETFRPRMGSSASSPGWCRATTAPSLEELRQVVADTIAPWAAPKELVIVDDLPRTAAGKIRRRELE